MIKAPLWGILMEFESLESDGREFLNRILLRR